MRNIRHLFVSLLLFAAIAWAQTTMPVVVAADKNGTPVAGLKAQDITVTVDGRNRAVTAVREITAGTVPLQINSQSGQLTNAIAAEPAGLTLIVFDTAHTRQLDEGDARQQVLKFLNDSVTAKRNVGLFVVSSDGVRVIVDPLTGPTVLASALKQLDAESQKRVDVKTRAGLAMAPGLTAEQQAAATAMRLAAFMKGIDANLKQRTEAFRAQIDVFMDGLRQVAQSVAGIPGRKSLVWVMRVAPFDLDKNYAFMRPERVTRGAAVFGTSMADTQSAITDDEFKRISSQWQQTIGDVQRAQVAVYPYEMKNLADMDDMVRRTVSAMESLGNLTGGRAFIGGANLMDATVQAGRDSAHYYEVTLKDESDKPGFHKIEVAARGPMVEHWAGYFAADSKADLATILKAELAAALHSPVELTGVPFTLTLGEPKPQPTENRRLPFRLMLPKDTRVLDDEARRINLEIFSAALDASGKVVAQNVQNVGGQGQLPAEAVAQIRAFGTGLNGSLEVPAGTYTFKLVLRDNIHGQMGSVSVPLTVK